MPWQTSSLRLQKCTRTQIWRKNHAKEPVTTDHMARHAIAELNAALGPPVHPNGDASAELRRVLRTAWKGCQSPKLLWYVT